jgi:hypothetical protein
VHIPWALSPNVFFLLSIVPLLDLDCYGPHRAYCDSQTKTVLNTTSVETDEFASLSWHYKLKWQLTNLRLQLVNVEGVWANDEEQKVLRLSNKQGSFVNGWDASLSCLVIFKSRPKCHATILSLSSSWCCCCCCCCKKYSLLVRVYSKCHFKAKGN